MSDITLSAATRQNLLSLQDTAALLSTTQTRLSTGKKVNSALDGPVNYFTAQNLNSRSSSLTYLLDGVSNGIQTIQAANTGITKLRGLTDQLKAVAQQALSASNAFTAKASIASTALSGATANNLLSVGATTAVAEAPVGNATGAAARVVTGTVDISSTANIQSNFFTAAASVKTVTIDGVAITLTKGIDDTSPANFINSINTQLKAGGSSVVASLSGSNIAITGTGDGGTFSLGTDAGTASLFGATPTVTTAGTFVPTATSLATGAGFNVGDNFTVNGQIVTVGRSDTLASLAQKVSTATNGTVSATYDATARKFSFTAADSATGIVLGDGSTSTAKVSNLGFSLIKSYGAGQGSTVATAGTPPTQTFTKSALDSKSISVKVAGGNSVTLSFGTAAGQISTLNQLNAALAPANAMASIDSVTGAIKISTTNESGADNLVVSASGTGNPFSTSTSSAIISGDGANTRNGLVSTYNGLLSQIDQMAADSGFNGTNLLAGDTVNVSFNERGTSSLKISGTAVTASGLNLVAVGQTDFQDSNSINAVIATINTANTALQSQASTLGANLAVVQNRQDFTKQMINVLDTGAANLTNADLNEEAANSQALSTRNSLGISALSLANTAQQGILQLLRG
ncbi:flagellin [Methylobacterium sp. 17Sr1-1]|uniref:flagellin N-terminal helical domain-containing protein n=1 Tax=Methylobacterium sp. 17Sr1-1 TaxID=2202826 RepID=UPI000D6F6BB6|nr:flagellin [Methylobacterium sp. 17Sr1-1]AWN53879.1 flagellar hook protein [Methylobacterium sp. 17Sr1-1]